MRQINFEFIKLDMTDLDTLKELYGNYRFKIVFHFAAYTHVDHSFGHPLVYTKNNVIATHNLLEVMKTYGVEKYIHVSTDEVYGDLDGAVDETSLICPTNPYSATKAAAEMLVHAYIKSFNLPAIITRGNNVYGPGQYPEKVIPRFLLRLLNKQKCQIQGSGKQTRSFLYAEDVADAFVTILEKGKIGEIYNIGAEKEISILEIAKKCIKTVYDNDNDEFINGHIEFVGDRDFNDPRYPISSQKLIDLGWKESFIFNEGLDKTFEWCKDIYYDKIEPWPKDHIMKMALSLNEEKIK